MIYFLHGDSVGIDRFISELKTKKKYSSILKIENDIPDQAAIDFILSPGLFITKKLLLISTKLIKPSKLEINYMIEIISLCEANNVDLIVIDFSLNLLPKDLQKKIHEMDFMVPKDDFSFKFCDELLINQNKKNSLEILINLNKIDDGDFYRITGLILTYIRLLLSAKYNNQTIAKQNKWFASKIISNKNKFEIITLKKMLKDLLDLDIKSKSTGTYDYKILLSDYVLYSF